MLEWGKRGTAREMYSHCWSDRCMCIIWPDPNPTESELDLSHAESDPVWEAQLGLEKTTRKRCVYGGSQTEAEAKVTSSLPEKAFPTEGESPKRSDIFELQPSLRALNSQETVVTQETCHI